jgi:DNA-binding response OmpR family regulator
MMPISIVWSRAAQSEGRRPDESRPRVLVVEDELLVGAMAADALEEAGFMVLTAASAEEARVILVGEAVDVLFSDIDLGGQDGCDLARQAVRAQPGLAVILTSGRSRRCHAERIPPGASFLAKPYHLSHLIEEVLRAGRTPSPH